MLRGLPYRTEALRDLSTLRAYLGGAGIMALFDAPWLPIFLAFIFLLHPFLGLLALGGAAVLVSLALANNALTSEKLKRANIASSKGYQNAEAAFRNAEVVDGMGMASALMRRWNNLHADVLQLQQEASDTAGLINACTKSLRMFLQIAVLGLGAWLVLRQELSAGSMVAASIIMSRALAPVEQAIACWKQTTGARDAWKRLSTLFQLPPFHPPSMPLPRPRGYLTIENVVYAPAGARHPVLRGISLSLVPGEALAIIGPSAAGKSTLARLIVGLAQPQHGFIRLDGADVFAWSRENFGQYVGYLPQDVELFPGTVRENIARMDDNNPSRVIAAAMHGWRARHDLTASQRLRHRDWRTGHDPFGRPAPTDRACPRRVSPAGTSRPRRAKFQSRRERRAGTQPSNCGYEGEWLNHRGGGASAIPHGSYRPRPGIVRRPDAVAGSARTGAGAIERAPIFDWQTARSRCEGMRSLR